MRKSLPKPTDAELAILQVLWRDGPSTVKSVRAALGRDTGYTTALKMLQIMTEKGLVRRDETLRAHVYEASASEGETQKQLVRGLLRKAFGGSASKLVLQALSAKRATPEELAEIKRLVQRLSEEAK